jgi:basic membrane protein A and related proteins
VKTGFVSPTDHTLGFADQAAGAAFTSQFLEKSAGIDVLFQAAGLTGAGSLTGKGIFDAACAAGIDAIGVDVDQHETYPDSQSCILTSAEKRLSASVADTIVAISVDKAKGGRALFDASNDGIGISPFYDAASRLPADIQAKVDGAISRMKTGSLVTCPPTPECGMTPASKIGD